MLSNVSFKEFCEDLYSSSVLCLLGTINMMVIQVIWKYTDGVDYGKFPNLLQLFQNNLYIYQLFLSYFIAYIILLHYSRLREIKILPDILDKYCLQIIPIGFAILFGYSLSREISWVTLCHGINMTLSLMINCSGQGLLTEQIEKLQQNIEFNQQCNQQLRRLLEKNKRQTNQNETIQEVADLVFSLKEKIPDGPYLELMDKMQSMYV